MRLFFPLVLLAFLLLEGKTPSSFIQRSLLRRRLFSLTSFFGFWALQYLSSPKETTPVCPKPVPFPSSILLYISLDRIVSLYLFFTSPLPLWKQTSLSTSSPPPEFPPAPPSHAAMVGIKGSRVHQQERCA